MCSAALAAGAALCLESAFEIDSGGSIMATHASQHQPLPTLASCPLPRRVRDLLATVLKLTSDELEACIAATLKDLGQQLHLQIAASVDKGVRDHWEVARDLLERSRQDVTLHFMNALEAEMANLQEPQVVRGHLQTRYRAGDEMALVNDLEIEETSVLTDSASRTELQHSLQLFLLGQRFGVLAGRPAFDVETLPVGPQALCRSIRRAAEKLGLEVQVRLLLYRAFERQVMPAYGGLVEKINAALAKGGVLPHLQYVPIRARRSEQSSATAVALAEIREQGLSLADFGISQTARAEFHNRSGEARPAGATGSQAVEARKVTELLLAMASGRDVDDKSGEKAFAMLRQLTASRRQLLGKLNPDRSQDGREAAHQVSANELQEALRVLQDRPAAPVFRQGRVAARNMGHIKQDMLALLRRISPNEEAPALADEHNDVLDLIGMLYDNLMKDMKPGSTGSALLSKLQLPLMRVALQDSAFFTRQEHPARQMLDTIAETSANWLADDDADGTLANQMNSIIDRAAREYRGDPAIFKNVLDELIAHLQTMSRKAEVAERRHVEAARGKEKLTLAREHASRSVEALVKGQKLPRFTRTMLSQAWTDVMALTALRQGEDSPAWKRQLQVAERLVQIAQHPNGDHPDSLDPESNLQREIEQGLEKVGYQGEDIGAIAHRLVHPGQSTKEDAGSRTELTMRLKAQARLGEDLPGKAARMVPLTSAEEAQMERIRQAPVGTWFEFVINPEGDRVRRRLSWLSTATGDALFVNKRGQKNAEYTLTSLARLMAKGQVEIIEDEKGTVLDRAWENVVAALRSFAVPENPQGGAQ